MAHGLLLRTYVDDKARAAVELSKFRHDSQEQEIRAAFDLLQGQLNKVWDRLEAVEDEDFKRPEAEQMRRDLTAEIHWLRDQIIRHNGVAPGRPAK